MSESNRFDVQIAAIDAATRLCELKPILKDSGHDSIQSKWAAIYDEVIEAVNKKGLVLNSKSQITTTK